MTTLLVTASLVQLSLPTDVSLLTSELSGRFYHKTLIVIIIWKDLHGNISYKKNDLRQKQFDPHEDNFSYKGVFLSSQAINA